MVINKTRLKLKNQNDDDNPEIDITDDIIEIDKLNEKLETDPFGFEVPQLSVKVNNVENWFENNIDIASADHVLLTIVGEAGVIWYGYLKDRKVNNEFGYFEMTFLDPLNAILEGSEYYLNDFYKGTGFAKLVAAIFNNVFTYTFKLGKPFIRLDRDYYWDKAKIVWDSNISLLSKENLTLHASEIFKQICIGWNAQYYHVNDRYYLINRDYNFDVAPVISSEKLLEYEESEYQNRFGKVYLTNQSAKVGSTGINELTLGAETFDLTLFGNLYLRVIGGGDDEDYILFNRIAPQVADVLERYYAQPKTFARIVYPGLDFYPGQNFSTLSMPDWKLFSNRKIIETTKDFANNVTEMYILGW